MGTQTSLPVSCDNDTDCTALTFCCREDGNASIPLKLPTNVPFVLYKVLNISEQNPMSKLKLYVKS